MLKFILIFLMIFFGKIATENRIFLKKLAFSEAAAIIFGKVSSKATVKKGKTPCDYVFLSVPP